MQLNPTMRFIRNANLSVGATAQQGRRWPRGAARFFRFNRTNSAGTRFFLRGRTVFKNGYREWHGEIWNETFNCAEHVNLLRTWPPPCHLFRSRKWILFPDGRPDPLHRSIYLCKRRYIFHDCFWRLLDSNLNWCDKVRLGLIDNDSAKNIRSARRD